MNRLGRIPWANEAVGALVLLALGLFFVAILQGGVLRQWFSPTETLRIVLPEQGLFGLAAGAPVEILGTKAGEVRRIVIDPGQSFYAEADIDDSMQTFVRRDSRAFIRKQFGIAGAAYLEITRGQGEPLDWDYAVVTAEVDRAPTENVGQLIEDLRAKVLPIIDKTDRAVTALAELAESLRAPDGDLVRCLPAPRRSWAGWHGATVSSAGCSPTTGWCASCRQRWRVPGGWSRACDRWWTSCSGPPAMSRR